MLSLIMLTGAGCLSPENSIDTSNINTPSDDVIKVKVARSATEQNIGLSGSSDIGDGMLFCFSDSKIQKFWMLGMHVEIDMIWIEDDVVTGIADNVPIETDNQPTRRESGDIVNSVLEVPAGMASELGIVRGSILEDVASICNRI
jgi:uncharacterized protein